MPLLYRDELDMHLEYRSPPMPVRQQSQHSDIAKSAIMSNAAASPPRLVDPPPTAHVATSAPQPTPVSRRDFASTSTATRDRSIARSRSRTDVLGAANDTPASTAPSSPNM